VIDNCYVVLRATNVMTSSAFSQLHNSCNLIGKLTYCHHLCTPLVDQAEKKLGCCWSAWLLLTGCVIQGVQQLEWFGM